MSRTRAPRARKNEAPPQIVDKAPLEEELDAALSAIEEARASGIFQPMAKSVIELAAPCACQVYDEGWYFAIVIEVVEDRVFYLTTSNDGDVLRCALADFMRKAKFNPVYTPIHTAIYFLSRDRSGLSNMRVRELRRLAAMITREELEKMSERELGQAYQRMVDAKGPQRVKNDKRAEYIDKILASVKDQTAKKETSPESAPGMKKARKAKAQKEGEAAAPKAPKEKKAKAPKEPKAPKKSAKDIKAEGGNPYREGSMKRLAFDAFMASKGNREKTVDAAMKAGATQSTAVSWFAAFNKLG